MLLIKSNAQFMLMDILFMQVTQYLNHENSKCSIIRETVQAMSIAFAADSPTKGLRPCLSLKVPTASLT